MSQDCSRLVNKTYEMTAEDDSTPVVEIIDLANGKDYSIQAVATDSDVNIKIYTSNDKGESWTEIEDEDISENAQEWFEGPAAYTNLKIEVLSQDSNPASASVAVLVLGSAE